MKNSEHTVPSRYAVIGHPVEHSLSPVIHKLFADQSGEKMSYELIDAAPAHFEEAVEHFKATGGQGLNVTVPHKESAFRLSDETGPEGARAGAVNTLSFLPDGRVRGDNTDGIGIIRDLTVNHNYSLTGIRILILGAGGATRGILGPLLDALPNELVIANRTIDHAHQLVKHISDDKNALLHACSFEELKGMDPFDLLINATSAGLKGEILPFPTGCAGPKSFCYDLAYSAKETPFLAWARQCSAEKTSSGWGMLVEQAAESFLIWKGFRPETGPALENTLLAHKH